MRFATLLALVSLAAPSVLGSPIVAVTDPLEEDLGLKRGDFELSLPVDIAVDKRVVELSPASDSAVLKRAETLEAAPLVNDIAVLRREPQGNKVDVAASGI